MKKCKNAKYYMLEYTWVNIDVQCIFQPIHTTEAGEAS